MVGIIVITYNIHPDILRLQVESIERFIKTQYSIEVIENSNVPECSNKLIEECQSLGINCTKHNSFQQGCSLSHSEAANFAYEKFKDKYNYMFFLDHDCIPVKEFNPIEMLNGKMAAGIPQVKEKTYPWPGCLVIDNTKIDKSLVDFSPCISPQLDTGGMLYKIFDNNYTNYVQDLDEQERSNSKFNKGFYTFYKTIHNETFIHFVNGSNWNNQESNDERISIMIEIVKELINGNN